MADKSYSFSVNVSTKEAESDSRRATVTTSLKDANGLENSYLTPVDNLSASNVNRAVGDGLRKFLDSGVAFVDIGEDPKANNPVPDGFQGDVPDSEKPKKDDDNGDSDKAADKKGADKSAKPAAPAAPDKSAAGDKPAPKK